MDRREAAAADFFLPATCQMMVDIAIIGDTTAAPSNMCARQRLALNSRPLANMRYFTTVRAATPPKRRTQKSPFSAATGAVVAVVAPQNVMLTDGMPRACACMRL